jgi:hypothetical protein
MNLSSHVPSIGELNLPDRLLRELRARGIVALPQVLVAMRKWSQRRVKEVLGMPADELRELWMPKVTRLLGQAAHEAMAQAAGFKMPSLKGIAGPSDTSPILRQRRANSMTQRDKVVSAITRLAGRNRLPPRMLLTDWMTPVRDQGHLGSCTGWASTANREMLAKETLSPLFAYMLAKALDGQPNIEGSWQQFCFQGFAEVGQVRDAELPYTDHPHDMDIEPYRREAGEFVAEGFCDVLLDEPDMALQPTLLKAILAGELNGDLGPQAVSVSIAIYESFADATTSLHGLVTVPDETEWLRGGHAMCVAGYIGIEDEANPYGIDLFVVKNSWSAQWASQNAFGFAGYALIPAAYFQQHRLLWEALVCLAETSPAHSGGWLDLLRSAWGPRQLAGIPASCVA